MKPITDYRFTQIIQNGYTVSISNAFFRNHHPSSTKNNTKGSGAKHGWCQIKFDDIILFEGEFTLFIQEKHLGNSFEDNNRLKKLRKCDRNWILPYRNSNLCESHLRFTSRYEELLKKLFTEIFPKYSDLSNILNEEYSRKRFRATEFKVS